MNDTPTPMNDEWIVTDNENYIEIASTKTFDSIASVHGGKTVVDQYDLAVRIAKVPQLERELTAVTEQRDRLAEQLSAAMEVVKAVSHIGIDWGYGEYQLSTQDIANARKLYEEANNLQSLNRPKQ